MSQEQLRFDLNVEVRGVSSDYDLQTVINRIDYLSMYMKHSCLVLHSENITLQSYICRNY